MASPGIWLLCLVSAAFPPPLQVNQSVHCPFHANQHSSQHFADSFVTILQTAVPLYYVCLCLMVAIAYVCLVYQDQPGKPAQTTATYSELIILWQSILSELTSSHKLMWWYVFNNYISYKLFGSQPIRNTSLCRQKW